MRLFNKKYNIAVFGADGMLGYDVVELLENMQLKKKSCIGVVKPFFGKGIDISNFSQIYRLLGRFKYNDYVKYDIVVNCAAMTDVNKIENDKQYRDKAYQANVIGPMYLAMICKDLKMKLVHVSTDYVYSEKSAQDWCWPVEYGKYTELHAFHENNSIEWPVNIYGMQKLIAEKEIERTLPQKQHAILRTSWLYGMHNSKSFIHKFLKNFYAWKKEHDAGIAKNEFFTLPDDQASIPTCTTELARMVYNVICNKLDGMIPACGYYDTSLGSDYAPSWFVFGKQILHEIDDELLKYLKPANANDPSKPKFSRLKNAPCSMLPKLYGCSSPYAWKEVLHDFMEMNRKSLIDWLDAEGCFYNDK